MIIIVNVLLTSALSLISTAWARSDSFVAWASSILYVMAKNLVDRYTSMTFIYAMAIRPVLSPCGMESLSKLHMLAYVFMPIYNDCLKSLK